MIFTQQIQGVFENANEECPINKYELSYDDDQWNAYQEMANQVYMDESGDLVIQTDVQEQHEGVSEVEMNPLLIYITATSTGNVSIKQENQVIFYTIEDLSFLNQAPNFVEDLVKQTIYVLEDNSRSSSYDYDYFSPLLSDLEGDTISVDALNLPIYISIDFDQEYVHFTFHKSVISKYDHGDHQLVLQLSDDSGTSIPRQVSLGYEIVYKQEKLEIKSYLYNVPEECVPLKNVTYVGIICPVESLLYVDICNDLIVPSRIKHEGTEEYQGSLTEILVQYDFEIFQQNLIRIQSLYAFTSDDFYTTISLITYRLKGHKVSDETMCGWDDNISSVNENQIKQSVQNYANVYIRFINNSWIFNEQDLQDLYQKPLKEKKVFWPFVQKVNFNKDMSIQVYISDELIRIDDQYIDLIDESVIEVSVESAVDSRVRYYGRKKKNESEETLKQYVQYLKQQNGYEEDEMLLLEELKFEWELFIYEKNSFIIQIHPYHREKLSLTSYGKDKIIFRLNPNVVIRSKETGLYLEEQNLHREYIFKINPYFGGQESLENGFNIAYNFAIAIQASTFALNIFLSKTLQDLWSLLNTLQLVIHLPLIEISVPGNAYFMMELMGQLTQKDMYPTDEIYGLLFNFTEKDYPQESEPIEEVEFTGRRLTESSISPEMASDGYSILGYDNSNFIPLSGSGLINIILAIVSMIIYNMVRYFCKKLYKFRIARKIGISFPKVNDFITLARFFIEGYLELLFSALISVISLTEDDFGDNRSDQFSAYVACFSLFTLLILPIYIFCKIKSNQAVLGDPDIQFNYGLFYQDLNLNNFYRSIFHVVFLMRRFLYVVTVMFLQAYPSLQLIILMKLSVCYICYIIYWQPFAEKGLNQVEMFNEICIYLVIVNFLIMNSQVDGKTLFGWVFVAVCGFNLLINLNRIARVLIHEYLPQRYHLILKHFEIKKQLKKKADFLKAKEFMASQNPTKRRYRVSLDITQLTYELQDLEPLIIQATFDLKQELDWFNSNNIDFGDLLNPQIEALEQLHRQHRNKIKRLRHEQRHFRKIVEKIGEKKHETTPKKRREPILVIEEVDTVQDITPAKQSKLEIMAQERLRKLEEDKNAEKLSKTK